MRKRVEEEYISVLKKLEMGICVIYDEFPYLTDYEVMHILENLINRYKYEAKGGKTVVKEPTNLLELKLYNILVPICENYLGRGEAVLMMKGNTAAEVESITAAELLLCLKRLLKSVQLWNKQGGRDGYLNFISQFIPVKH